MNHLNSVVHNEAPVALPENLKWRVPATDEYSVHLFRHYNVKKAESNHSSMATSMQDSVSKWAFVQIYLRSCGGLLNIFYINISAAAQFFVGWKDLFTLYSTRS